VFIQIRLKEPEKWVKAREEGRKTGARLAPTLRSSAKPVAEAGFAGHVALHRGVVGLWGVGFFSPELSAMSSAGNSRRRIAAEQVPDADSCGPHQHDRPEHRRVLCMMVFTKLATVWAQAVFAVAFVAAFLSTAATFKFLSSRGTSSRLSADGFCSLRYLRASQSIFRSCSPRASQHGHELLLQCRALYRRIRPFTLGLLQAHLAAAPRLRTPNWKLFPRLASG